MYIISERDVVKVGSQIVDFGLPCKVKVASEEFYVVDKKGIDQVSDYLKDTIVRHFIPWVFISR